VTLENGLENPHEATLINPNQSEIMMEHFMIMSYNVSIVTRQLAYGNEGTFMRRQFLHAVEENPIIAAVKDNEGLEKACKMGELTVIFVLYGGYLFHWGDCEPDPTGGETCDGAYGFGYRSEREGGFRRLPAGYGRSGRHHNDESGDDNVCEGTRTLYGAAFFCD
jgi:hypothetical protein